MNSVYNSPLDILINDPINGGTKSIARAGQSQFFIPLIFHEASIVVPVTIRNKSPRILESISIDGNKIGMLSDRGITPAYTLRDPHEMPPTSSSDFTAFSGSTTPFDLFPGKEKVIYFLFESSVDTYSNIDIDDAELDVTYSDPYLGLTNSTNLTTVPAHNGLSCYQFKNSGDNILFTIGASNCVSLFIKGVFTDALQMASETLLFYMNSAAAVNSPVIQGWVVSKKDTDNVYRRYLRIVIENGDNDETYNALTPLKPYNEEQLIGFSMRPDNEHSDEARLFVTINGFEALLDNDAVSPIYSPTKVSVGNKLTAYAWDSSFICTGAYLQSQVSDSGGTLPAYPDDRFYPSYHKLVYNILNARQ